MDVSTNVSASGADADTSTLVIKRLSDDQVWISNAARASVRYSPASTSKIPHTLIALEELDLTSETPFIWNGAATWNDNWNRDHTLVTAFQQSVVWAYQDITTRVGYEGMQWWMAGLSYGNQSIGSEEQLTSYWLDGTLRISAQEQIDFLSRLVREQLPLANETYAEAADIMEVGHGAGWSLMAKTGWWYDANITDIGWYVGWLTCEDDAYVFAFNLDMPDRTYRTKRQSVVGSVLSDVLVGQGHGRCASFASAIN
ncbi:penicillin-binding transpeptidase domain-containing protein [Yoonia sp. GPGPB17]|uniref:penicillin-binding transpeptidase domain-containing protein n=1 Tax=Yoonia sp. GPGPB17 TaxID=3026147 RepID=UPI0030BBC747